MFPDAVFLWHAATRYRFLPDRSGQGLVEYALILILVSVIVVLILGVLGEAIRDGLYENIVNAL